MRLATAIAWVLALAQICCGAGQKARIAAPAEPAPTPPRPFACVADAAEHGATLVLARHSAELSERLGRPVRRADVTDPRCVASTTIADLDGDGAPDLEISEGCTWGTYGALRLLYFSNHGCRRFAGELVSGELRPLATRRGGVRDLEATWSNGCAGNDFVWQRYSWTGDAYRVVEEATCHLCAEQAPPSGANRHPYCQTELARRLRD
jgi:hypothetical protein